MTFRFEQLTVWQKSIELCDEVVLVTKGFPKEEMFGLTSQIRRSASSIPLNIAEGSGRPTKKDFKLFLGFARGSLFETVCNLHICKRRGFISDKEYEKLYRECELISKMLSSLRSTL